MIPQPAAPPACPVAWTPGADRGELQQGFAQLASSVAVVTWRGRRGPAGLAVQSLASVSVSPPRLLFCVDKQAPEHADLLQADGVAISLLAADQAAEAGRFAPDGPPGERFDPARWSVEPDGPPVLRDPAALFLGPVRRRIDAGPVTIFVVDVARASARQAPPLIQFAGPPAADGPGRAFAATVS